MVHNAFHQEHSHGRAFHNHAARHILEAEVQDGNIKLNVPRDNKAHFIHDPKPDNKLHFIHNSPTPQQKDKAVHTVYTQVRVTVTPGAHGDTAKPTPTRAKGKPAQASKNAAEASYLSAKSAAQSPNPHESSTPARRVGVPTHAQSQNSPTTRVKGLPTEHTHSPARASSSTSAQLHGNAVGGTPVEATRGPTAVGGTPVSATKNNNPNLISQNSDGMSTGAKAGLAFGIIAIIAVCGGLVFYFWRRRKQQQLNNAGAEKLDEKHESQDSFFGGMAAAAVRGPNRSSIQSEKSFQTSRTATTAPQLSLRPVTQFLPNITENRKSGGNTLDVPAMSEKPKGWGKPSTTNQQNPFDDAAVISEKQARSVSPPANPFEDGNGAAKNTPSHSQKNSWEDSEPMTPSSTMFGTAAAVPIAAAGAPNGGQIPRGPNNVHRVQLDFKPSMDDELELRSGQLVRMLHEYDDGWALCIRMDRSQQGVCPRTCLSKLPVKPRPQGPPPPNGPPGRPMGPPPPGMRRPASPQMANGMVPRPLTPTGRERSHTLGRNSPAPLESVGRPRSQSMGGMASERPMSPNGMPSRKPVPGQAL